MGGRSLSSDFEGLHQKLDGHMISITGAIFVDPLDPVDSARSKERMIHALKDGGNVMWFPEGDWNLSPGVLVLPLFWGMAEVALATGARGLPIGLQMLGKEYHVNIGQVYDMRQILDDSDPLSVGSKQVAMDDLRERLATLAWEILEQRPREARQSIPQGFHANYINARLAEWPINNQERIEKHYLTRRLAEKERWAAGSRQ